MTQRSRPRFIYLTVYGIVMLMLIPYPTTECPPIAISLVDQNDAPIAGIRAVCRGGFYADYFQSEVKFDQRGQLILPAHRVWLSGVQRILEVAGSMLPHGGGFRSASADVSFAFPTGAARLDAAKEGTAAYPAGLSAREVEVLRLGEPLGLAHVLADRSPIYRCRNKLRAPDARKIRFRFFSALLRLVQLGTRPGVW